jgi:hypothetical protein
MAEGRKNSAMLMLALMLIAANVLFFTYTRIIADERDRSAAHLQALQINPARIKLVSAGVRSPRGEVDKAACLEWGPLALTDAAQAEAALRTRVAPQTPEQRKLADVNGMARVAYYVRDPTAEIVARIAELQRSFPQTQIKAGPCPA